MKKSVKKNRNGTALMANELRHLRSALEAAEAGFKLLFDTSSVALICIEDGRFSDCNPAALELFGVPGRTVFCALQASDLSPLCQSDGQLSGPLLQEHLAAAYREREYRCNWQCRRLDNGEAFPCEIVLHATVPEQHSALLMAVYVSDSKEAEDSRAELAYHDKLTHLPNRRLFHDRLINVLAQSRRYQHHAALIVIDIGTTLPACDVRAQQDQSIADRLRCEAARRISAGLRSADTLARLDRDDFVVLLGDLAEDTLTATAQAHRVADKIASCVIANH